MNKKPLKRAEQLEIVYNHKHWIILKELRLKTIKIMEKLSSHYLKAIVHGSVTRGDVSKTSDIDIFFPDPPSSFLIEMILEQNNLSSYRRTIIQATPIYALKGYIELDENCSLSFPLVKLRQIEKDFYKFGGQMTLSEIKKDTRVSGIDNRLMLIEPTTEGHIESSIIGREKEVSHLLRVSINTIFDHVRTLLRRDKLASTGVFIERELASDETFEQAIKKLADKILSSDVE